MERGACPPPDTPPASTPAGDTAWPDHHNALTPCTCLAPPLPASSWMWVEAWGGAALCLSGRFGGDDPLGSKVHGPWEPPGEPGQEAIKSCKIWGTWRHPAPCPDTPTQRYCLSASGGELESLAFVLSSLWEVTTPREGSWNVCRALITLIFHSVTRKKSSAQQQRSILRPQRRVNGISGQLPPRESGRRRTIASPPKREQWPFQCL